MLIKLSLDTFTATRSNFSLKITSEKKMGPDIVYTVFMETEAMGIILLVHQLLHIRSDATSQKVLRDAYYFFSFSYKTLVSS